MDVGFYLGELLMQQGEVKVPGLGHFSQVRMSAYYDENEALFYPPYNKVHFEPQADLDNSELAEYLVNRKGISLASAKYFIEKYIANLRQQAIIADVPLANMGVFYTDGPELSFKPNDKVSDDSELYGYAPVKINKANAIPADPAPLNVPEYIYPRPKPEPDQTEIIEEDTESAAEENIEEPLSSTYDEAFLDLPEEEEEEESRGPLRGLLIALVIIAVLAVGLFALYRYQPATFNKLQFWKNNKPVAPVKTTPKIVIAPKADSLHTDTAKTALNDSTAKVADTVKAKRFELITGKGFKNLWAANKALKNYRAIGLTEAKFSEDRPGNLIKISIASFNSISESEAMKQQLIKEGKLTKGAYTIEIPQQ